MAITLENPYTPPAPTYDKVHLDHLTITAEQTDYGKVQIQGRVRLYFQDENGVKIFAPDTRDIVVEDAMQLAISLAAGGDNRGVDAVVHITSLVMLLIELKTPLGVSIVN